MKAVTKTWLTATLVLLCFALGRELSADGISGSGYARSSIERFGGVVLDGVHYDTSQAVIRVNGVPAEEHELKVGQIVLIRGDLSAGEAQTLDYYDTLRGTVQAVQVRDSALGHLVISVMNQTVVTSNKTWFHDGEASDVAVGTEVAISGHWDVDGTVMATSVTLGAGGDQIVTGRVIRVHVPGHVFRVGNVLVASSLATKPSSPIGVGTQVFVRGEYHIGTQHDGALAATEIQVIELRPLTDSPAIIEGVLQPVGDGWQLDGQPLQLLPSLRIDKGSASDLVGGAVVQVRGQLGSDGVLRAIEIRLQRAATSRIDGHVRWVDTDKRTLTIDGVELHLANDVMMQDDRDGDRRFALESLVTDDAVSVTVEERDGRFYARSLARKARVAPMYRARVQSVTELGDVHLLGRNVRELVDAETIRIDGKIASSHRLRQVLRHGHELQVTWNESGQVQTVDVFTDVEKQSKTKGARRR